MKTVVQILIVNSILLTACHQDKGTHKTIGDSDFPSFDERYEDTDLSVENKAALDMDNANSLHLKRLLLEDKPYVGVDDGQLLTYSSENEDAEKKAVEGVYEKTAPDGSKTEMTKKVPSGSLRLEKAGPRFAIYSRPGEAHGIWNRHSTEETESKMESFLLDTTTGNVFDLKEGYFPVPETVKYVEVGVAKFVYMLAHNASTSDSSSYSYYSERLFGINGDKEIYFDGGVELVSIEISQPDQPIFQVLSGNLNVETYEVDNQGNAIVKQSGSDENNTYGIVRQSYGVVRTLLSSDKIALRSYSGFIMTSNDGKFLSFTTPLMNTKIEKFELYIDNNRVSVRSLASVETDSYLYGLPSGTPDKMQIGSDSFVLVNHNLYKFPEDLSNLQGIKVGSSGYYKESKLHYHSTTGKIGVFHKKYDTCSVQIVDTGLETAVELDSSKLDGKLTGFHSDEVGNWRVEALDEANSVRTVYRIDPSTSALTLETADQFKAVNTGITVLIKRAN